MKKLYGREKNASICNFRLFILSFHAFSEEAMQSSTGVLQRSGAELENTVFLKARSRDEYLVYINKLILHCNSECLI